MKNEQSLSKSDKRIAVRVWFFILFVWLLAGLGLEPIWAYQYKRDYLSYWNLAEKSSTLAAKQTLISKYVELMESHRQDFAAHNAVFLTTPDNSFENNFTALKTLNTRLAEINKMDVTSFQYNTAMEQITKQEQGEAHRMLAVFEGCWYLKTHPMWWGWIQMTSAFFWVILLIGVIGAIETKD